MPRVLASDYQTAQFEFSFTSQRPKTPLNLSRILGKTGGNWFEAGVFYFLPKGLPIALVPTAGRDTGASDSASGCAARTTEQPVTIDFNQTVQEDSPPAF